MWFRKVVCLLAVVIISGCGGGDAGPDLVPVTGTVLYQGKPLSGATVTMQPEKGPLANGFTDAEGKFRMSTGGRAGVPVGNVKVGIKKSAAAAVTAEPKAMKPEDMMSMQKAGGGVAKELEAKPEIPLKYATPESSGLVAIVDKDAKKNVFEYVLVD